jgi:phasin protein
MNKPSLRRPPSARRPARRSLVELTAAASRELQDGLPPAPSGPVAAVIERTPHRERAGEVRATPKDPVAAPDVSSSAVSESRELPASERTADMAVKIVKEFQARALEDFRIGMNAALDYAKDFVDPRRPADGPSKGDGAAGPKDQILTGLGAAAQYRAEAFELLNANLKTMLDYAHEIARARTPAELVELSSEHGRRQCEHVLKQAGALKSLARAVTKPG